MIREAFHIERVVNGIAGLGVGKTEFQNFICRQTIAGAPKGEACAGKATQARPRILDDIAHAFSSSRVALAGKRSTR